MDIEQIRKLVEKGETENLEFKRSTGQLERAMKTTCAFLNGFGGTVLIGVKENGEIIGQNVGEGTIHDIIDHLSHIEPPPPVSTDEFHYMMQLMRSSLLLQPHHRKQDHTATREGPIKGKEHKRR